MWRIKFLLLVILIVTPVIKTQANPMRRLSLKEAILLAVRENPNVQASQLSHVEQKFQLEIQQWQFHPHFGLQASTTTSHSYSVTSNGYVSQNATGVQASASLLTPIGTQMTLTSSNNVSNNFNPGLSLQIMQPLMQGFGKPIVEAALNNAIESETISRLNVEGTLRATVTNVINAYLDVVSLQNTLAIDQQALMQSETSKKQTQLFIKSGHKAGVELVAVLADVASAQTRIENDKNNLDQARFALLASIGIDPNTPVTFDNVNVNELINKYHIPPLDKAKKMILENDIQYQTDQITLNGSIKRNVMLAEDNTRWKLDLTVNSNAGGGTGGGRNAGINSLVNGVNQTNSASLNLTVPIDDRPAKLALASAKIALRQAEIALQQEKWDKETSVINSWNSIYSALRATHFAENAKTLQEKTYHISFQKYSYGLIDSLELQTSQQQYSAAQQTLLNARISYLKALMNLDLLVGTTLKTWDVKVQYL